MHLLTVLADSRCVYFILYSSLDMSCLSLPAHWCVVFVVESLTADFCSSMKVGSLLQ